MVNICKQDGCNTQSSFNFKGENKGLYCCIHKKDKMINVIDKKCQEIACNTLPIYNYKGEIIRLYCNKHKKDGMINVKDKHCMESDCYKIPQFNYNNEKKGIYCATHKKDNMINVKDNYCQYISCNKLATFNYKDKKVRLYCNNHKQDGMVSINKNKCLELDCNIRPIYNYKGYDNGIYCLKHKKNDMINVIDKKCQEIDCNVIPYYNYEGESKSIYCNTHKKEGMIDIQSKRCKTYLCNIFVNNKYEGYCLNCFIHLFPDKPNSKNYKTKEKATVDYIIEQFRKDKYTWITDKKIQDGCSKKRPDILLDLGYQVIIIEVDENQHESYDCSCENKRLMILSQDVGYRPIIFIRFNPDDYIVKDNKITSCWANNKLGICAVKKTKQKEWDSRLEALKGQIEYWVNPENKTDKTIEIIQLFYDSEQK